MKTKTQILAVLICAFAYVGAPGAAQAQDRSASQTRHYSSHASRGGFLVEQPSPLEPEAVILRINPIRRTEILMAPMPPLNASSFARYGGDQRL